MAETREIKVSTTNKASGEEIEVTLAVDVPANAQEASSEEFYGSETEVTKAIQGDWATRLQNAVRAQLREASADVDFEKLARSTADSYKPGRRGGFQKLDSTELEQFDSVDDLIAHLRATGRVA